MIVTLSSGRLYIHLPTFSPSIGTTSPVKMPGSSLWLTPPPSHPLYKILTHLIESTIPDLFPTPGAAFPRPPVFAPHLTLTSNIDPAVYGSDPQGWLDSLPFARQPSRASQAGSASGGPEQEPAPTVLFERVKSEDVFFRRCYIKCAFTASVRGLAGVARAWGVNGDGKRTGEGKDVVVLGEKTERWLEEWKASFGPHVSLM